MTKFLSAIGVILVIATMWAAGFGIWSFLHQHRAAVTARANTESTAKEIASGTAAGHDAVQAVQSEAQSEAASAALTRRNTYAIKHADGAETPVEPAATDAGLRALCLRHVYRNNPACRQLQHPGS